MVSEIRSWSNWNSVFTFLHHYPFRIGQWIYYWFQIKEYMVLAVFKQLKVRSYCKNQRKWRLSEQSVNCVNVSSCTWFFIQGFGENLNYLKLWTKFENSRGCNLQNLVDKLELRRLSHDESSKESSGSFLYSWACLGLLDSLFGAETREIWSPRWKLEVCSYLMWIIKVWGF